MTSDGLDSVLAHPLRRAVVRELSEQYLPQPVPSFATYIALVMFPGRDSEAEFVAFRDGIERDLRQTHLPKLAEADVLSYDPETADGILDAGLRFEEAAARLANAKA